MSFAGPFRVCLGLLLAAVFIPASLGAQTPAVPTFTAGKLDASAEGPVIDGRVNDAVWQTVPPYSTFTQQDPIEGAPASEKTEVRIIVGKGNVYIGIIAFDSDPSKIIVSQSRRDASLNETDSVVMVFDTFNDNQNAFVFGTNPLGIEYDGQVAREGQSSGVSLGGGTAAGTQRGGISAFNPNWDGDWTVRAQITERGWEMGRRTTKEGIDKNREKGMEFVPLTPAMASVVRDALTKVVLPSWAKRTGADAKPVFNQYLAPHAGMTLP